MGVKITTSDRLQYLKNKAADENITAGELLDIAEFFAKHLGLFGDQFNAEIFLIELHEMTAQLKPSVKSK
jgi:hypothetical protein